MDRKILFLALTILYCLFFNLNCSTSKNLNEEDAKKTIETFLTYSLLSNNSTSIKNWEGLIKISKVEMHGKALVLRNNDLMRGSFIFHKKEDGGWILDKVEFESENKRKAWKKNVFEVVGVEDISSISPIYEQVINCIDEVKLGDIIPADFVNERSLQFYEKEKKLILHIHKFFRYYPLEWIDEYKYWDMLQTGRIDILYGYNENMEDIVKRHNSNELISGYIHHYAMCLIKCLKE